MASPATAVAAAAAKGARRRLLSLAPATSTTTTELFSRFSSLRISSSSCSASFSATTSSSTASPAAPPRRCLSSASPQAQPQGEIVTFLGLNNLSDNPGAVKRKRRVGRGIGSSKGKTCGRGHKGQKARSGGNIHPTFEGGQTKFYKRVPKRGFSNKKFAQPMVPLNVGTIADHVLMGRLDAPGPSDPPITLKDIVDAGILNASSIKHGVKLLAKGKERLVHTPPLRIDVSRASEAAIAAIEEAGGEVTTVHYNKLALRALLKPHKFDGPLPKRALPPPKLMQYYTDYDKRGYLSPEVQLKKLRESQKASPVAEEKKPEEQ